MACDVPSLLGDRSEVPCGPFAVPRAGNSREQSRTADQKPQCYRRFRGALQGSEPATFHRGDRFELAFPGCVIPVADANSCTAGSISVVALIQDQCRGPRQ